MTAAERPLVQIDLATTSLRDANSLLQASTGSNCPEFKIFNPAGTHALACGLDAPIQVTIEGHAGYFCGGMNQSACISVNGNVGQGVGENMMSGRIAVHGNASQSAAASAHGGLLVIRGDASARCGISLKGGDIVVEGNVGHLSMFMAQSGRLVVLGDAGEALGDSVFEARIYVRGKVAGLGADCMEKPLQDAHRAELRELLDAAGHPEIHEDEFRRYGSARKLYNFTIDDARQF